MIFLLFRRLLIGFLTLTVTITSIYLSKSATNHTVYTLSNAQSLPVLVIDAGHGGIDSGTSGGDGTPEKNINLSISRKLNEILTLMGYKTIMTRTQDELIGEGEFTTIRSQKQADVYKRLELVEEQENCILISVHQNYFQQNKYSGFQVFYTNNHPQNKQLAQQLQSTVTKALQPHNTRTVKTVGSEIYLLHHCTKPAVMVECGFLSNPKELSLLKNETYQNQMAFALAKGIDTYLQQNSTLV